MLRVVAQDSAAPLDGVAFAGDHLLARDCLYGGTHDFLTDHAEDLGWSCSFVQTQRPETWSGAVTPC